MTAQQTAIVDMVRTVVATSNANLDAWELFAPYNDAVELLIDILGSIDEAIVLQGTNTTGVAVEKNSKRRDIVPDLLKIAAMLGILGTVNSDDDMRRQGDVTQTDLERSTDDAFFGMASRLIAAAQGLAAATRDPYMISNSLLATLTTKLGLFRDAIGTPRKAKARTIRATKQLAALIADAMDLLESRLDKAAYILNDTQPSFYTEYTIAREVIDPGSHTRALDVKVVSVDGTALEGVEAIIVPGAVEKRTSAKGAFYVGSLGPGNYNINFNRPGFLDHSQSFSVVSGIRTDLVVVMTPIIEGS